MKSSPWLAVAVKARAPAAEAPIETDIAANSDSTLMNSHGERVPAFTIAPIASMMCVWGEMGYAQTTSGRQRATVSATAREPSICRSTDQLLFCKCDESIGSGGGGGVALTDYAREAFADRRIDGVECDLTGQCRGPAEQRRVRQGTTEPFFAAVEQRRQIAEIRL